MLCLHLILLLILIGMSFFVFITMQTICYNRAARFWNSFISWATNRFFLTVILLDWADIVLPFCIQCWCCRYCYRWYFHSCFFFVKLYYVRNNNNTHHQSSRLWHNIVSSYHMKVHPRSSHCEQNHTNHFCGFLFIGELVLNDIFIYGVYYASVPVPVTLWTGLSHESNLSYSRSTHMY